jgi:serine/threonine protein kinase
LKVFKGIYKSSGKPLAIKQLYLADGTDQEVESLEKEINVIRNLNHDNIVRFN